MNEAIYLGTNGWWDIQSEEVYEDLGEGEVIPF